jgi:glucose-6-phosphate 1-dehydrogenase
MSTATEALTATIGRSSLRKRAHTSIEDCGETIDEDVFGRFMQLVAVAAIEAPGGKDAKTQKDAKYALFRSVETADPAHYVRGHAYAPGSWGPPVADELLGRHSTWHGPWLPS